MRTIRVSRACIVVLGLVGFAGCGESEPTPSPSPKPKKTAKTDGGAKEEIIVDMDAVLKEGNTEADVPLQADDFIIVPRSKVNF